CSIKANPQSDLIGGFEAYSPDIGGQTIRILSNDFHGPIAIGLVNPKGAVGADAVGLQENQNAPDRFLFLPAFANALNAARSESLYFFQESRTFVNDAQGSFAECLDDLVGIMPADAFDQS